MRKRVNIAEECKSNIKSSNIANQKSTKEVGRKRSKPENCVIKGSKREKGVLKKVN